MNRRTILGLLMILAFGAVRMPFEARLEAERKALYFHGAKFNLSLQERVGQMAFVAALSGFHPQTLLLWASKGRGPAVTPVEGRLRYRVSEVRRWLSIDETVAA